MWGLGAAPWPRSGCTQLCAAPPGTETSWPCPHHPVPACDRVTQLGCHHPVGKGGQGNAAGKGAAPGAERAVPEARRLRVAARPASSASSKTRKALRERPAPRGAPLLPAGQSCCFGRGARRQRSRWDQAQLPAPPLALQTQGVSCTPPNPLAARACGGSVPFRTYPKGLRRGKGSQTSLRGRKAPFLFGSKYPQSGAAPGSPASSLSPGSSSSGGGCGRGLRPQGHEVSEGGGGAQPGPSSGARREPGAAGRG